MDTKVNHFLVRVTSGVTMDKIVAAAKDNKDKIFFAPNGQIVVGAGESNAEPIKYGVDEETQDKINGALQEYIKGTRRTTVLDDIYDGDNEVRNDMIRIITNSDCLDVNDNKLTNALKLVYVPAADSTPAHIALSDKSGKELTSVNVSDIIGNGMLNATAYDQTTGILKLTFNQANGTTKDVEVDLKAMLDLDDIVVSADSTDYLKTDLPTTTADAGQLTIGLTDKSKAAINGAENALHSAKVTLDANTAKYATAAEPAVVGDANAKTSTQELSLNVVDTLNNLATGTNALASAKAAKEYVDAKNVDAEGDAYVTASAAANKVTVAATDKTKASLALADTAVQSITPAFNKVVDGTVQLVTLDGAVKGTTYTLAVGANKGELPTTDSTGKFDVTTYGIATAGNVHDFVMAYVAYVLDNYNPWTTYEG